LKVDKLVKLVVVIAAVVVTAAAGAYLAGAYQDRQSRLAAEETRAARTQLFAWAGSEEEQDVRRFCSLLEGKPAAEREGIEDMISGLIRNCRHFNYL
jgi:hypothetical protein